MATLEQVEKLRQKVNCTYEEAKSALEMHDDDMLEALIYLEKQGKQSNAAGAGSYTTEGGSGSYSSGSYNEKHYSYSSEGESTSRTTRTSSGLGDAINSFFAWLGRLIKRGNANSLEIINHDKVMLSIPLTVLVLLLVFCFWFMIPAFIIGLFCGLRYQFRGKDFEDTRANEHMNNASRAAENAKQKVKEEFRGKEDNSHYKNNDGDNDAEDDGGADF